MVREKERLEAYQRTVALGMVLVILVLAFLIVRPFLVAILAAAALAYIFYPVYRYILSNLVPEILPQKTGAAIITCALIILIVLIPTAIITSVLTFELRNGYVFLQEYLRGPSLTLPVLPPQVTRYLSDPQFKGLVADFAGQFLGWLQNVFRGIPNLLLSLFITVFSTYYFLKHGKDLYNFFRGIFPLPEERYKQMLSRFDDLSRGMILGQIVVGIIQGVLAWAGFWYLGVPNPVLWGFLTAIISIIPLLGAAIVWVPIAIYLFVAGYFNGNYWPAITLLIYGTFVISLVDNILKPKIVGERAKIHPLIILFGILGGIQLFGVPGILIGPLILTLFDLAIEIYRETL